MNHGTNLEFKHNTFKTIQRIKHTKQKITVEPTHFPHLPSPVWHSQNMGQQKFRRTQDQINSHKYWGSHDSLPQLQLIPQLKLT